MKDTTINCDACGKEHNYIGLLDLKCTARTTGPLGFEEFQIEGVDVCDLDCLLAYIEKRRDKFMTKDCHPPHPHIPPFGPVPYVERKRSKTTERNNQ